MNNKGFLTIGLILAIAVGILIVIVGLGSFIGILFSTKFMLIAIGVTIVIMTIIYLGATALKSDTAFTNKKVGLISIFLLVGVLFIFSGVGNVFSTSFAGNAIYIPLYGSMTCDLARSDYNLFEKFAQTTPLAVECGKEMNGYTDTCNFQIKIKKTTSWSLLSAGVKIEKCNHAGDCKESTILAGKIPNIENTYYTFSDAKLDVNNGGAGDGYIDSQDGDVYSIIKITPLSGILFAKINYDVRVLGNAYYLKDSLPNGYGTTYLEGCNLLNINTQAHITKKDFVEFNNQQSANQVPFGKSIYYVFGYTQVITSNVIMKGGKQIYIQKAGYAMPIKVAEDGYKYADWQNEYRDDSIQCLPSNVYVCNVDATIRKTPSQDVSGQDCSIIRGVPKNDYLKISETSCCKFSCVNNKLQTYSCEKCAVCEQGYAFDQTNNRCVKVGSTAAGITDEKSLCEAKAKANPFLGYIYIEKTTQANTFDKIKYYGTFGIFGTNQPTVTTSCSPTYIIYYVLGAILIVIFLVLISILKSKKKKVKKKK